MVVVLAAALLAQAVPDCPGAPDKPAVLRCWEAGDRAATVALARAEVGRTDATPGERRFAVELADAALRELHAKDGDPSHLCVLRELLTAYVDTPGAVAAAGQRREEVTLELKRSHPAHRCGPAEPTRAPVEPSAPVSRAAPGPPEPPPTAPTLRRRPAPMTIGGLVLLATAAGLGAGALGLAAARDDLRDRMRAVRDGVWAEGWTPELQQARDRVLADDRRFHAGLVGLGVSTAVAAVVGASLIAAGEQGRRRAEIAPQVGAGGAGLVLSGRF